MTARTHREGGRQDTVSSLGDESAVAQNRRSRSRCVRRRG